MPNREESEIIRTVRERAAAGNLQGVDVIYRVTGGAPGEQIINDELRVAGPGTVHARASAAPAGTQENSAQLAPPEMQALVQVVSDGVGDLIPRSEARFIPDTIVGQVLLRVDGKEASFFFLPDTEQAKQHGKPMSVKGAHSIDALDRLHKRMAPR